MLDQHKIIFQEVLDDAEMAELDAPVEEQSSYASETNDWPQNVYYAWVLYGAASYMCAIYWIQRYYFQNWYGTSTEYLSLKPGSFTTFGMGETINRLMLIIGWSFTALAWTMSLLKMDGVYFFFTMWARILHHWDVFRIVLTTIFKVIGMGTDTQEDYLIEDGLDMDEGAVFNVSMEQSLDGTDWYMESFGLTVSFSLFGDLLGIAKNVKVDEVIAGIEEDLDLNDDVDDVIEEDAAA